MLLLWATTIIPQARPLCDQFSGMCKSPVDAQLLFLYTSYGLMSIGAGGMRSCSLAFVTDQLGTAKDQKSNAGILEKLFSWNTILINVSVAVALTCVVYIQEHLGWLVGFGVPTFFMLLSVISFFLASPLYTKLKPNKSAFTGLAQVVVACYKNRGTPLPSSATDDQYYYLKGSMATKPSEKLRYIYPAVYLTIIYTFTLPCML